MSTWEVTTKKKVKKNMKKLPPEIQVIALALTKDLVRKGVNPGKRWKNYSKLGGKKHHCHLTYSYVACWEETGKKIVGNEKNEKKEIKLMEIYYVGSRESAPY